VERVLGRPSYVGLTSLKAPWSDPTAAGTDWQRRDELGRVVKTSPQLARWCSFWPFDNYTPQLSWTIASCRPNSSPWIPPLLIHACAALTIPHQSPSPSPSPRLHPRRLHLPRHLFLHFTLLPVIMSRSPTPTPQPAGPALETAIGTQTAPSRPRLRAELYTPPPWRHPLHLLITQAMCRRPSCNP
jgi:hypothetical protein